MHKLLKKTGLIAVWLAACLSLLTGCQGQKGDKPPDVTRSEPGVLIITGNGVDQECRFTTEELKSMEEALAGACYSALNNWPAKKFIVGKGIKLTHLLQKAGIKEDAQTITVRAADGYSARFTMEQLEEKRFCFPNLIEDSPAEAVEVPMILAWEYQEDTTDLSKAASGKLRLIFGQTRLNEVVTAAFVKDVAVIEVSTAPPGQWSVVWAEPAPGKVKQGTEVILSHPEQDLVKIHYTVDGSDPDRESTVYNPSTTYFRPELNKPIPVDKPVTIKAIAIGFGKHSSQVATFKYDVEEN
ncbi:MAG: chitobiase/beta-hexosaminidase C-terminal domain-containing protein [Desulfotomaculaceae bacterium]|nr:chitobiase/beta-hexosaminidase C-terminal domain-containing protein [Desulfotomaculaceae bacterium]